MDGKAGEQPREPLNDESLGQLVLRLHEVERIVMFRRVAMDALAWAKGDRELERKVKVLIGLSISKQLRAMDEALRSFKEE